MSIASTTKQKAPAPAKNNACSKSLVSAKSSASPLRSAKSAASSSSVTKGIKSSASSSSTAKSSASPSSTATKKREQNHCRQGVKNKQRGKLGEDLACKYLQDSGFAILHRNWTCPSGEADIIAEEEGTLVFIEVKTRSASFFGLPEAAVTHEKRRRYERIAISYLTDNTRASGRVRFDVIAIQMTGPVQCLLKHHRDAFGAEEW